MKIVESADGTVKVVELDPAKKYIIVMDDDALSDGLPTLADGEIILKRAGASLAIVETAANLSVPL